MRSRGKVTLLGVMAALVLAGQGCVRSKVIVTTDPPNALVTMNGVELGRTPVEQPFTWYWYYDFIATKPGFEPAGVRRRFHAPPWLWPGFDLVMEAMPFYVTNKKKVHLVLEPVDERPRPAFVDEPMENEAPTE